MTTSCCRCGATTKIHKHHVNVWRNEGLKPDRSIGSQTIALCSSCHSWVHSSLNVNDEYLTVTEDRPIERQVDGEVLRGCDRLLRLPPYGYAPGERWHINNAERGQIMSVYDSLKS